MGGRHGGRATTCEHERSNMVHVTSAARVAKGLASAGGDQGPAIERQGLTELHVELLDQISDAYARLLVVGMVADEAAHSGEGRSQDEWWWVRLTVRLLVAGWSHRDGIPKRPIDLFALDKPAAIEPIEQKDERFVLTDGRAVL